MLAKTAVMSTFGCFTDFEKLSFPDMEQENDLLVCGDCQTSFPLHDIVHFIKHKKKCCPDKENKLISSDNNSNCRRRDSANSGTGTNTNNNDDDDDDDDDDDEDDDVDISDAEEDDADDEDVDDDERRRRRKEKEEGGNDENKDEKEKRMSMKSKSGDNNDNNEKERGTWMPYRKPLKQKQVVDAESNTTHSEPSRFVCETCRSTYTSAWGLLQHAQKEHGMKIYTSPSSISSFSQSASSHHSNNSSSSSSASSSYTGIRPSSSTPGPASAGGLSNSNNNNNNNNNTSPIDLVMTSSTRSNSTNSNNNNNNSNAMTAAGGGGRQSASSTPGSVGCVSPFPAIPHPPNPFAPPFRLPLTPDGRLPHPTSISPFTRPSLDGFDLINDTRLRPQYLAARGLQGLEHSPFHPSPFDRSRAVAAAAAASGHLPQSFEDFYSMRLRQLACSPGQAQIRPGLFNTVQAAQVPPPPTLVPSSSNINNNNKSSERPASADAPLTTTSPRLPNLANVLARPQKTKACEFCGKTFRFKSNLIVHRRSHTGEKPFKCPMCPHACTQQSKLKRHMKTHSAKSENIEGEVSPGGTPYPKPEEFEEDDEEEEEEEEDEEIEGEEDDSMMEEEMNDEERAVLESMKKSETSQVGTEPGEISRPDSAKGIKRERNDSKDATPTDDNDNEPSDLSMKKPRTESESLLSEVMKNTGLNSIQTYSEAYQAALAESQKKDEHSVRGPSDLSLVKRERKDAEPMTPRSRSLSPSSPRLEIDRGEDEKIGGSNNDRHPFLGGTDLLGKNGKKSNASSPGSAWNPSVEPPVATNPIESAASMFSRIQQSWFHHPDNPVRFFLPGYPARFPPAPAREFNLSRENHGLNLSPTTTNSALSSTSPSLFKLSINNSRGGSSSAGSSPTTSLLLPTNGGSAVGGSGGLNNSLSPLKKESRRNDTCEYCGKVFKNCSNLTVHRRSHTGEKPYKCVLCSYACAQSSKLTRHMKTHGRQGKDVYTCKFCNMPFSVPSTLEKHMRKCVENRQRSASGGGQMLGGSDFGDLSSENSNGEMGDASFISPADAAFISPPDSHPMTNPPDVHSMISPPDAHNMINPLNAHPPISPPDVNARNSPPDVKPMICSPDDKARNSPSDVKPIFSAPDAHTTINPPDAHTTINPLPLDARTIISPPDVKPIISPPDAHTTISPPDAHTTINPLPLDARTIISPPDAAAIISPPSPAAMISPPSPATMISPPDAHPMITDVKSMISSSDVKSMISSPDVKSMISPPDAAAMISPADFSSPHSHMVN